MTSPSSSSGQQAWAVGRDGEAHSRAELGSLDVVLLGDCVGLCVEPDINK